MIILLIKERIFNTKNKIHIKINYNNLKTNLF